MSPSRAWVTASNTAALSRRTSVLDIAAFDDLLLRLETGYDTLATVAPRLLRPIDKRTYLGFSPFTAHVMQAITSFSPIEAGADMVRRETFKTASAAFDARPISMLSEATEIFDTDFEDDSDYQRSGSFESYDSRRRSQTTISSYDEATTPISRNSLTRNQLNLRIQPVEGPKGPHLFRSSRASAELDYFDYALQMSPVLPKEEPPRTDTALSNDTVMTPVSQQRPTLSLDSALCRPEADPYAHIRSWSPDQVIEWMYQAGMEASVMECFEVHDINGAVLLDLDFDDLKELGIQSFGKRHSLWNAICLLRGEDGLPSPTKTPFQDISRPCTSNTNQCATPIDDSRSTTPSGRKRRGRKAPRTSDVITPAESVSIVAIEQLLPKPHKCAKGERCAKWRKQQRELQQLHDEHGIGRFPVSPTNGGRIFVAGDPGNAVTAANMVPTDVLRRPEHRVEEDPFRPTSEAMPSVIASSGILSPGQLPEFALHEDVLNRLGSRDPQDNVKHFLHYQHMSESPLPSPTLEAPGNPSYEMFPPQAVYPFPAHHQEAPAVLQAANHDTNFRSLSKLDIPRSVSAGPQLHQRTLPTPQQQRSLPSSISRAATASPSQQQQPIYRLGTPASEVDVPVHHNPSDPVPVARDTSQSVPPNMQYRPQASLSRAPSASRAWRRPSLALPSVSENAILTTGAADPQPTRIPDPAHHPPTTKTFGYGPACTHSGWMRKRTRTKFLRHEWSDTHCRLTGTELAVHENAKLNANVKDKINVEDYAVACSSVAASKKLSSAFKVFSIKSSPSEGKDTASGSSNSNDSAAFAFQLIPQASASSNHKNSSSSPERKGTGSSSGSSSSAPKTHYFAVKTKDDRIDWMRELMLAKALQQKGQGFEVEVNGVRAE
ncbi:unnamed protein product [Zymoseptoria tritici ST99CH_1A5]|uniref:SAM domain-containing protein n=1 Tax=Zymoseptoria tritici ST99CH_1A5 TaxID=1276529 RepID=A0A1Y6LN48_ZYMTR|nr:unnamed protein product [Zymoseptoria tritici ST99CH_1A5]